MRKAFDENSLDQWEQTRAIAFTIYGGNGGKEPKERFMPLTSDKRTDEQTKKAKIELTEYKLKRKAEREKYKKPKTS